MKTLVLNRIFDGWFFSIFNVFPFWDYESSWNEHHIHHFFSTLMCFHWVNIDFFCDAYCLSSLESCSYPINPKTKKLWIIEVGLHLPPFCKASIITTIKLLAPIPSTTRWSSVVIGTVTQFCITYACKEIQFPLSTMFILLQVRPHS